MLEAGTIINDRYKIVGPIGEGGMGAVYEAEHTGVGRRVAIKVLLPEFARNAEVVGRFEREARAAAAIGHDNIIDVLDVGTHDGAPFMVMEILKGESLATRIERAGALSPESAAYVMAQVISALGAAHAAGIIHRDLKPDNVYLVTKAGVRDFVKLLDFGISKFKDDGKGPAGSGKTQTGALMGTPVYMSPEQATAKRDIDHRADLYSAGVMLFEMVTAQAPFNAESHAELLMDIVYRPNGVKSARSVNPTLPPEFDAIVSKAMAKDRDDRYQDAGEFLAAITPWIGSAPIAADATGTHAAIPKPAKTATLTPSSWETGAQAVVAANATPVKKQSAGLFVGGGLALVAALGIGGFLFVKSSPPATPAPTTRAAVAAPIAPATPAISPTVVIDLAGLPTGARIDLDGHAVNSPHLVLDRGTQHALRITADGHQPYETSLTAERDREIMVALADAPAAPATTPVVAPATEAPAVAARTNTRPRTTTGAARTGAPTRHAAGSAAGAGRPNATPLSVSSEF